MKLASLVFAAVVVVVGCSEDPSEPDNTCASAAECGPEAPECVSSCYGENPAADCPPLDFDSELDPPGECMLVEGCNHSSEYQVTNVVFDGRDVKYSGSLCAGPVEGDAYKIAVDGPTRIRYHVKVLDFGRRFGEEIGFDIDYFYGNQGGFPFIDERTNYYGHMTPDSEADVLVTALLPRKINAADVRTYEISFRKYDWCDAQTECAVGTCVDGICANCVIDEDCSVEFPVCRYANAGAEEPKDCYPD